MIVERGGEGVRERFVVCALSSSESITVPRFFGRSGTHLLFFGAVCFDNDDTAEGAGAAVSSCAARRTPRQIALSSLFKDSTGCLPPRRGCLLRPQPLAGHYTHDQY